MDENPKRLIKMEIWIIGVSLLVAIFSLYNTPSKIMNESCVKEKFDLSVSCTNRSVATTQAAPVK